MIFYRYQVEITYKNINSIRIKTYDQKIYVNASWYYSEKKIYDILEKNKDKILKMLQMTSLKDEVHLLGQVYQLELLIDKKNYIDIIDDKIVIHYKKDAKKVLYSYYEEVLISVLNDLKDEAKKDFNLNKMPEYFFSNMQTRYAYINCKEYYIKFARSLAKYNKDYIKLILYHELTHLSFSNHGSLFYQLFEAKYNDAKRIQHRLRMLKYQDKF